MSDVTVDLSALITEGSYIYIESAMVDGNQLTLNYNNEMSPIVVDLQEQSLTNSCIDSVAINKRTLTFSYNTQNPAIQIDLPAPESSELRPYLLIEDGTFINNAVLEANDDLVLSYNKSDMSDVTVDVSALITEGSYIYIESAMVD